MKRIPHEIVEGKILKRCNCCEKLLELKEFGKDKATVDSLTYCCKECQKDYRNKHKIKQKEQARKWYLKNGKEYSIKNAGSIKKSLDKNIEKRRERSRKWYMENKERCKESYKRRRTENLENCREYARMAARKKRQTLKGHLSGIISCGIRNSLRGNNKNGHHWESLVGYTVEQLIKRLNQTMPEGYTWQDYMEGKLHIDHKIPKSVFNYETPLHIDFRKCWALDNLQLLTIKENLSKHCKLTKPFQASLNI